MADDPWGIDTSAVDDLIKEMRRIRSRLQPAMRKVAVKGAMNIRDDARALILSQARHGYIKQYPNSITYTVTDSSGATVTAEVGPDKDRAQGALGNILEYGTSKHPPYPHLQPALLNEADRFEDALGEAAENAVFE